MVKWLKPLGAVSVENAVGPGTPDVAYVGGWLELKSAEGWPARPDTPLRLPHYTPQQRVWHVRWSRAGGSVHVLLKVAQDWLLIEGAVAAVELGDRTREELLGLAVRAWERSPGEELAECLRKISPPARSCSCGDGGRA